MNNQDLVRYLYRNRGEVLVGKADTLESAKLMEEKGFLVQVGTKDGNPIFRLTDAGTFFVKYAVDKLGETNKAKAKNFLKSLGKAMDNYIQDYKAENPVGMEDLRRAFGGLPELDDGRTVIPSIEPRLAAPVKRALPNKTKSGAGYIRVNGKLYKKVEE